MWNTFFEKELASLETEGMLRELFVLPQPGGDIPVNGSRLLNFSSNDYLGLAGDRRLKDAAIRAVEKLGCGATASRLMAGHLALHEELEADLARLMGTEAALVFGSGFLTNLGVVSTIAGEGDAIFSDRLNHASLIDGSRLSHARRYCYRHKDLDHLEALFKKSKARGKRVILSESVFSMDGDIAPVGELAGLSRRYGALLIIDEAHAIGVMGARGGGVCRIPGSEVSPDITIGTLSKALGGYGGFVACSQPVRRFLINRARSFIYSTALPPPCLGSGRAAVAILNAEPGLGRALLEKARWFHSLLTQSGLTMPAFESQILPVLAGDVDALVRFTKLLRENGILVRVVRPPTVPVGTSRVRLSVTLSMSDQVLKEAAATIGAAAQQAGIVAGHE